MSDTRRFDAIVVGSGATGGWAAKQLTEAGLSVLLLDAGPAVPREQLLRGEGAKPLGGERWAERHSVQTRHAACTPEDHHLFIDDVDNPYVEPPGAPFNWIRSRQLGGRTLTWGRTTLRMSDYEFKAASQDGFDVDWPISHADLAPHYDTVERFLGVMGSKDGVPQLPDGSFASAPAMSEGEKVLKSKVEARWPTRRVITARGIPLDPGSPWPRFTSNGSTLAAAQATGRLTIRTDAVARAVTVDPASGRANGVSIIDRKTLREESFSARVVVLCASTIESARLLLNSATRQHPDGLGNSSGLLGRYLSDHVRVLIGGLATGVRGPMLDEFDGPDAVYFPKFKNILEKSDKFIRGYGIFGGVQRKPLPFRDPAREDPSFVFAAVGEHLPRPENRVTLDPEVKDRWGIPAARIDCRFSDNERAMAADALETLREIVHVAGFEKTFESPAPANPGHTLHEVGTARMGTDPKSSVLNWMNQSWDVRNLFVVDGASWVSNGCQNTTLTLMAVTVRACQHIVAQLRRNEL